jgi:hypothetical protein
MLDKDLGFCTHNIIYKYFQLYIFAVVHIPPKKCTGLETLIPYIKFGLHFWEKIHSELTI